VTVPGGKFIVNRAFFKRQEFAGAPAINRTIEGDSVVFGVLNGRAGSGGAFAEDNPFSQQGKLLP